MSRSGVIAMYIFYLTGDVDGSVEAILGTLETYQSHLCRLSLIHHGLGEVTLNDVEMAKLFNGIKYI